MKPHILFVDDEVNNLKGLKRAFFDMHDSWDFSFVDNAEGALSILSRETVHALITDMRMPQIDGGDLSNLVRKKWPNVVRVILSGYSDYGMIVKTMAGADRFISKPFNVEELKQYLIEIFQLSRNFNTEVLNLLGERTSPIYINPILHSKITELLKNSYLDLNILISIVIQDPALVFKIMNLSNCEFLGHPHTFVSFQDSFRYFGLQTFNDVFKNQNLFIKKIVGNEINNLMTLLSNRAVLHSRLARHMAEKMNENINVVFPAVLFLYLAPVIVFMNNPQLYDEVKINLKFLSPDAVLDDYFKQVFQISLNDLNLFLCLTAYIPQPIVEIIRNFSQNNCPAVMDRITQIIHASGSICNEFIPSTSWPNSFHFLSIDKFDKNFISEISLDDIRQQVTTWESLTI